jgi:hypothetical protein
VSEKMIAQQQAGFVRRRKPAERNTADLVWARLGRKFVVVEGGRSIRCARQMSKWEIPVQIGLQYLTTMDLT